MGRIEPTPFPPKVGERGESARRTIPATIPEGEMRSALVIFLCISLGSSVLFAAILPGTFLKTFGFLFALHLAASFIGLGNLVLGKWASGLPWADRAILKRAAFHVA